MSLKFTGSYNGDNHTISELTINRGGSSYVGLFGAIENATIENLGIIDADITGGDFTGALAGEAANSTINNSYTTGSLAGDTRTGGLVGLLRDNATINNSYNTSNVNGVTSSGGLAGENFEGTINSSFNTGSINGGHQSGGVAGYNSGTINNSYSTGKVAGTSHTGGFVGENMEGTINDSYSIGRVTGTIDVGGAIGSQDDGSVFWLIWNSETSGQSTDVGEGDDTGIQSLTNSQMTTSFSFFAFDFDDVWAVYEDFTFPYLQGTAHRTAYIEISGSEGWRMMTPPLKNVSYGELLDNLWTQGFTGSDAPAGSPNVFTWDEASGSWNALNDAATVPETNTGFIVYVYDDQDYDETAEGFPKSLHITAEEDTGSVSVPLTYTDAGVPEGDGWNLVGNPYASPINWDAAGGWTRTNLDAPFYVWNDDAGEYQSWNGSAGTLGNGLIAPWQGFWVKATDAAPVLELTNDVRSTGGEFLKKKPVPQLKFELSSLNADSSGSPAGSPSTLRSSTILMFGKEARIQKDSLDAWKLQPLNANYLSLFTQLPDGNALDINALPSELEEPLSVDMDIDGSDLNGKFELSWNLQALPDGWQFTLLDNVTEEVVDLSRHSTLNVELSPDARSKNSPPAEGTEVGLPVHRVISPEIIRAKSSGDGSTSLFTLTISPNKATGTEWPDELPAKVALAQNYPNPFNPSTVIRYQLPANSRVRLEVFDMLGRKVSTLVNARKEAGYHQVTFNANNLASGMYIYRLIAGNKTITKKLTLIK